ERAVLGMLGRLPMTMTRLSRALSKERGFAGGEITGAVESCLAKGFVREVDYAILQELKQLVRANPAIAPICGYPCPGDLDIAPFWAELFVRHRSSIRQLGAQHIHDIDPSHFETPLSCKVSSHTIDEYFFASEGDASLFARDHGHPGAWGCAISTSVVGP